MIISAVNLTAEMWNVTVYRQQGDNDL